MGRSALGFGLFLGVFNGASCSTERLRDQKDFFNSFVSIYSPRAALFGVTMARPLLSAARALHAYQQVHTTKPPTRARACLTLHTCTCKVGGLAAGSLAGLQTRSPQVIIYSALGTAAITTGVHICFGIDKEHPQAHGWEER